MIGIAAINANVPAPAPGQATPVWSLAGQDVIVRTAGGLSVLGFMPVVPMVLVSSLLIVVVSALTPSPAPTTLARYFPASKGRGLTSVSPPPRLGPTARGGGMGSFQQDLAHAVRRLARRPAFTLVAAGTLAVGIGGATAIFSVAHAVILRPLPYAEPDRLALVWQSDRERGQPFVEMSYPTFRDWRASNPGRSRTSPACRARTRPGSLTGAASRSTLVGRLVSVELLRRARRAARARPRAPAPRTIGRGAPRVVVLEPRAVARPLRLGPARSSGRAIVLDHEPFTVVGVMPRGFAYPRGRRALDAARARA